jgi:hypothetical protein
MGNSPQPIQLDQSTFMPLDPASLSRQRSPVSASSSPASAPGPDYSHVQLDPSTFSPIGGNHSGAQGSQAETQETGILPALKRNTVGVITGLYHAFSDPATEQEKAEILQKVRDENANVQNPKERVPESLATNPSRATLALHRILDAPAQDLRNKAKSEEDVAKDLLNHHEYWKGGNMYLSSLADRGLAAVPVLGPAINAAAQRAEGGDVSGAAVDVGSMVAAENAHRIVRGAADTAGKIAETGADVARQIFRGEKVAQPAAEAVLRSGADAASPAPVSDSQDWLRSLFAADRKAANPSLRAVLEEPIDTIEGHAKAAYRQLDEAAGTDFKALREKLENTEYQLRQLTETEEDVAKEASLEKSRTAIMDKIEGAKQQAIKAGVDPKLLDQADAQFKQASALKDLQAKVFKNTGVISGNKAVGAEESVNVNQAVKELQKLQDNTKFGAPRLEQALGKDGAQAILKDMYAAQRQGVKAMSRQEFAVKLAKYTGWGSLLLGGAGAVRGALHAVTGE